MPSVATQRTRSGAQRSPALWGGAMHCVARRSKAKNPERSRAERSNVQHCLAVHSNAKKPQHSAAERTLAMPSESELSKAQQKEK